MTANVEPAPRPGTLVDDAAIRTLDRSFRGELVRPGDPSYDRERRVWNGSIDRHPALVARCRTVGDVQVVLAFARQAGLKIAVRGGGHSFPGFSVCDDGVVIDLRSMNEIQVDPEDSSVRAQAGVLLGELDGATQRFGLAVPSGSVTHTGLAGLTLGGGFGWLMRKYGLTIDQLISAEVVTADGELLHASEATNPDLFWGIRGGGGNFGIVTEFEYRLNAVGPTVLSGLLVWPLADGARVVRRYRDWAATLPNEMTTALVLRRAPAVDVVPAAMRGQLVVGVGCCWAGDVNRGDRVLAPMRRIGGAVDLVGPRAFVDHQAMFDSSFPPGIWVYSKATDVAALTDDVLDILLEQAALVRSPRSGIIAWQLGGAVGQIGPLDTPFGSRAAGYIVDIVGVTDSEVGFEQERDWARGSWDALAPYHAGAYVNWLMDEGERRVREAYGEQRYARLQAIKRQFDPENVFRLNQNIQPL